MKILLHICCGNCAAYPFKLLQEERHDYSGFWFNPNIHPYEEYSLRLDSLKELAGRWFVKMHYTEDYDPAEYFKMFGIDDLSGVDHVEEANNVERAERCKMCYKLRLEKTAEKVCQNGFDAFSTTLLISPYQDFEEIAATGKELAEKYNILFYVKDFRPHFRKSQAMAKELGLYRQKYCGCIFSREERRMALR
ncbi:MAG: epoxyqueuosine reductase QueH [Nitrospirae bacterium]|nr:epoxyqueuosine reductase QueH [Nitrospirota bacterium]